MKLLCDVCNMVPADLICPADEAALCSPCDAHVHAANKLASRHERLPLLPHPLPSRCDICQEKTGYFFCLDDRALLCRECDYSIHSSNDLVSKHKRFLLTTITVGLPTVSPPPLPPDNPRSISPPTSDRPWPDVASPASTSTVPVCSTLKSTALFAASKGQLWADVPAIHTRTYSAMESAHPPNTNAHSGLDYHPNPLDTSIRCSRQTYQASSNGSDYFRRSDSFLNLPEAENLPKMDDLTMDLSELITDPHFANMPFTDNSVAGNTFNLVPSISSTDLTNSSHTPFDQQESFPQFDLQKSYRPTLKKRKHCLKV